VAGRRRPRAGPRRTYAAQLCCGVVLTYEVPSFLPDVGERVPCPRHGFCRVGSRDAGDGRGAGAVLRTVPRRSQQELLAFLGEQPVTSVHVLRRHRFSLRLVTAAQQAGLVDVDLATGRVTLPGTGRQPP
jgi:hypothetical protein